MGFDKSTKICKHKKGYNVQTNIVIVLDVGLPVDH